MLVYINARIYIHTHVITAKYTPSKFCFIIQVHYGVYLTPIYGFGRYYGNYTYTHTVTLAIVFVCVCIS